MTIVSYNLNLCYIKLVKASTDVLYVSRTYSHSMKYVPPDGFFGIQILQNSTSPEAVLWTLQGSLDDPPDPIVSSAL